MAFKDLPPEEQKRIRAERRAFKKRTPRIRKNKKINRILKESGYEFALPLKKGKEFSGRVLLRRGRINYDPNELRKRPLYLQTFRPIKERLEHFFKTFCYWDVSIGEIAIRPEVPREEMPDKLYWNFSNILGKKISLPPHDQTFSKAQMIWFLAHGEIPDRVIFLNRDERDSRLSNLEAEFYPWNWPTCSYFNRVEQGAAFAEQWIREIEADRNVPFWLKAGVSSIRYAKKQNLNKIKLLYELGEKREYRPVGRELRFPQSVRCDLSTGNPIDILRGYHELCLMRKEAVKYLAKTGLYELKGVRANYLTQSDQVDWREPEELTDERLMQWCSLHPRSEMRPWLMSLVSK
jgi:hypothetical protein